MPCAGGLYGNTTNLGTSQCSGQCPAGYFCAGAWLVVFGVVLWCVVLCGDGRLLCALSCSHLLPCAFLLWCAAGAPSPGTTINPSPCGNATVYCPVGSLVPVAVQGGYFSAPATGVVTNATDIMAQQLDCPAG